MINIKYNEKVVENYIKKYQEGMKIPSNWNSHNLKKIVSDLSYGLNDEKSYTDFFKLTFFEQCIYFCRYGIPYFIELK